MSGQRSERIRLRRIFPLLLVGALVSVSFPSTASAIPAWSRMYSTPCSTCHYPAPPRLNVYGHKFRRAQFRLPGEFGKDPDISKLQNYVAMRIRGGYQYTSTEDAAPLKGTADSSTLKFSDATLFYAGPVTKNFSGFVELERPGDATDIEAVVSAGGVYGKPDSFWTFRLGQFHTLARVGWGGLDRPTGISTPDALTRDLTSGKSATPTSFSGGTGFKLNQDQVGVEGTYVHKNWRVIAQILNGPDTASKTTDHNDDNKSKDGLLAWELMWGDTASGLTAFGYRGVQDDPNVIGAIDDTILIQRYGVTAAQVWKNGFEVQGGFVRAKDGFSRPAAAAPQEDITGQGWWVEVEKYFEKTKDLTLFARYDRTDGNTDVMKNTRRKVTGGVVWPVGQWHGRWALELRNVQQETATENLATNEAVVELMLNL